MKVGDYVRTKNLGGSIEKIIEITPKEKTEDLKERYLTDISAKFGIRIKEDDIIKSSSNIVDLIEVGDILKLKDDKEYQQVIDIDNDKLYLTSYIYTSELQEFKNGIEEDIEWVITREQIEDMKYGVK